MTDLKRLIDLVKDNVIDWSEDDPTDIREFMEYFTIRPGQDGIDTHYLNLLYYWWSKEPTDDTNFMQIMRRYVKIENNQYLIDKLVFKLVYEEFNKKIYNVLRKRLNDKKKEEKSKNERSLGNVGSGTD